MSRIEDSQRESHAPTPRACSGPGAALQPTYVPFGIRTVQVRIRGDDSTVNGMITQPRTRRTLRVRSVPMLVTVLLLAMLATPAMAAPPPSPATLTSASSPVLAATATADTAKQRAIRRGRRAAAFARRQLGKPYRWGGTGPRGYDCSGLTRAAWSKAGKSLPHSSRMQAKATRRVSPSKMRVGDLLFYGRPVHHVAIYVGKGKMIEAPRRGLNVRNVPVRHRGRVKVGRP